jgi:hypothetical protein
MKKIGALGHHGVVWTVGAALLAAVAAQVVIGLVLKAVGLLHGVSLTTWLLDVQHNMGPLGAAGGIGAGAAGGAGGPGPPNGKDPDPCAGLQRGYDQEQAKLNTIAAQQDALETAYDDSLPKLSALYDQFQVLAPSVQQLVMANLAETGLTAALSFLADVIAEVYVPELETTAALPAPGAVFDCIKTVTEVYDTISGGQVTLEQIQELAQSQAGSLGPDNPTVTSALNLVSVTEQMQELAGKMINFQNQYDIQQVEYDAQAQRAADAYRALQDCLDNNAGDEGAGGSGSGGGDSEGGASGGADPGADV